jgi:hypothetical protein
MVASCGVCGSLSCHSYTTGQVRLSCVVVGSGKPWIGGSTVLFHGLNTVVQKSRNKSSRAAV